MNMAKHGTVGGLWLPVAADANPPIHAPTHPSSFWARLVAANPWSLDTQQQGTQKHAPGHGCRDQVPEVDLSGPWVWPPVRQRLGGPAHGLQCEATLLFLTRQNAWKPAHQRWLTVGDPDPPLPLCYSPHISGSEQPPNLCSFGKDFT